MPKILRIVSAVFLAGWGVAAFGQTQTNRAPVFHSAVLVSGKGVPIPFNSVAVGMVELHVSIGQSGKVKDVQVVRELTSVTEQSVRSVRDWKFDPATSNGKPVASMLTVAIIFCPYNGPAPLPLAPLETESQSNAPDASAPVEFITAQNPRDFNARTSSGTVILQVGVEPDGGQGVAKVVKAVAPMTDAALEALKEWKFAPATVGGREVRSSVVLAFVYRPPQIYIPN